MYIRHSIEAQACQSELTAFIVTPTRSLWIRIHYKVLLLLLLYYVTNIVSIRIRDYYPHVMDTHVDNSPSSNDSLRQGKPRPIRQIVVIKIIIMIMIINWYYKNVLAIRNIQQIRHKNACPLNGISMQIYIYKYIYILEFGYIQLTVSMILI